MNKPMTVCCIAALAFPTLLSAADPAAWTAKRKEAVNRPRTVMYYNGGEEPLFWPKGTPFSVDAFLAQRISPHKDTRNAPPSPAPASC